jgi:hypothetical protein
VRENKWDDTYCHNSVHAPQWQTQNKNVHIIYHIIYHIFFTNERKCECKWF